ncbi:hypothetical protein RGQ15_14990 [Paracoccus sp. MBLB3053]|uniref:DUF2127 domain-containing protein n=1 Tax=Paracoccus aurantius TaxID=3073814 RepID=A0ABU2HWH9_9RHOB|nr:hypothetical protein [Paracoccus sp. MBLB3053]MDS9468870.1 hypothetical protein [Paracoccus sp. MBLB3053]
MPQDDPALDDRISRPAPPRSGTGTILRSGLVAAVFSLLALGVLAILAGQPFWMPLNVTTQALWGPEVALIQDIDLSHTLLGLAIHVASCLFWALIAWLAYQLLGSAALAGSGTALLALVIDYGILPERMSPGWHLALPFGAVVCGFAAMGLGLWIGVRGNRGNVVRRQSRVERTPPPDPALSTDPTPAIGPEALRHPTPNVVDQRQQRIDPVNAVTEDPNKNAR